MATDAFIFDVFGTVVDWRTSVVAGVERFFAQRGYCVDSHRFTMDWRKVYLQGTLARSKGGELNILPRGDLAVVLKKHGVSDLTEAEQDELVLLWYHSRPWPDSIAGLAALRAQRPIVACSNASVAMLINMSRHAGLVWDAVFGAEIAKAYKPASSVYLFACKTLRLAPERVTMVAAHNLDLAAARELGLQTAFIRRPDEKGADGNPGAKPDQRWDTVADDLMDLAQKFSSAV